MAKYKALPPHPQGPARYLALSLGRGWWMSSIVIRALGRADAATFWARRLAALKESPEAFGSTYEEDVTLPERVVAERLEESVTVPRKVVLGAFDGDRLVGFVGCVQESKIKARH